MSKQMFFTNMDSKRNIEKKKIHTYETGFRYKTKEMSVKT